VSAVVRKQDLEATVEGVFPAHGWQGWQDRTSLACRNISVRKEPSGEQRKAAQEVAKHPVNSFLPL
jgi:hypothetical protein